MPVPERATSLLRAMLGERSHRRGRRAHRRGRGPMFAPLDAGLPSDEVGVGGSDTPVVLMRGGYPVRGEHPPLEEPLRVRSRVEVLRCRSTWNHELDGSAVAGSSRDLTLLELAGDRREPVPYRCAGALHWARFTAECRVPRGTRPGLGHGSTWNTRDRRKGSTWNTTGRIASRCRAEVPG
jgi:hypothetical protein